eukprot:Phypoly_transcript_07879.p1 GENE.Phypoly_transcript_07879~~Phypoly_transcript_07879.p1  ORF type:complete len:265 (+),score=23.80 Phypoly_transcript_07879:591-1385(+)
MQPLSTIPEEVIRSLREELREDEVTKGFPQVEDGLDVEQVLFCEPPRGIKILATREFIIWVFVVFMIPVVFALCVHQKGAEKLIDVMRALPLFIFVEVSCCYVMFHFFYFEWNCYQVITNLRVARILCHDKMAPQIQCSYFIKILSLLRKHKLTEFPDSDRRPSYVDYLALIYKDPKGEGGKASIFGPCKEYTFTVSNIEFLENALLQVLTDTTRNWPKKRFLLKNTMSKPIASDYVGGIMVTLFASAMLIRVDFETRYILTTS